MLGWAPRPPVRNRLSEAVVERSCVCGALGTVCGAPSVVGFPVVAGLPVAGAYCPLATLAAVSKSRAAATRHVLAAVGIRAVVGPDLRFRHLVEERIDDRARLDGGERRFQRRVRGALRFHRDRKSTRLNSSYIPLSRMPSSA